MLPVKPAVRDMWRVFSACRSDGPGPFLPGINGSVREAKQICSTCPGSTGCLEDALSVSQQVGVRGGLTVAERRRLRMARRG